jgi:hypothetical protein
MAGFIARTVPASRGYSRQQIAEGFEHLMTVELAPLIGPDSRHDDPDWRPN